MTATLFILYLLSRINIIPTTKILITGFIRIARKVNSMLLLITNNTFLL